MFRYLCIVMVCMVSCSREVLEEEERSPLACLSTEPITHTHTRLTMLTRPGLHRVNTDHQQCEPGLENSHQLVEEEHHTSYTHHTIQQQVTICHNTAYQNIFFKNIGSNIVKIPCSMRRRLRMQHDDEIKHKHLMASACKSDFVIKS